MWNDISFHWSPVCVCLIYLSPIFTLILAVFGPQPISVENAWLFSTEYRRYQARLTLIPPKNCIGNVLWDLSWYRCSAQCIL